MPTMRYSQPQASRLLFQKRASTAVSWVRIAQSPSRNCIVPATIRRMAANRTHPRPALPVVVVVMHAPFVDESADPGRPNVALAAGRTHQGGRDSAIP